MSTKAVSHRVRSFPNTGLRTVGIWARVLPKNATRKQTWFIAAHRTKKMAIAARQQGEVVMRMTGHYHRFEVKP